MHPIKVDIRVYAAAMKMSLYRRQYLCNVERPIGISGCKWLRALHRRGIII